MVYFHYHTIKNYDLFQFRKEKPAFGLHKVQADIFDRFFGSLPFRSGSRRGGRKGGVGGIPPAEPREFRSDIFKQTPHRQFINLSLHAFEVWEGENHIKNPHRFFSKTTSKIWTSRNN